jgi:ketosteroid isomerase-like protein
MTDERFDAIRQVYAAINARDVPSAFHLMTPDVEWVNPPYAIETGTRVGCDDFARAVANVRANFPEFQYTIVAMNPYDDDIVVKAKFRRNARARNDPSIDRYHVWTLRGGRICRFRWFSTAEEAVEAAEREDPVP